MSVNELQEFASRVYFGNALHAWAGAAVSFALWFTVLPLVRAIVVRRLRKLHPAQSADALELVLALLRATTRVFLIAVAAWFSLRWLTIPGNFDRGVSVALHVILWFQAGLWGMTLVTHLVHARRDVSSGAEGAASLNILRFVAVAAVWAIALLMLLGNLGVEIMPLLAGLGIGGIAIALAVQNVLGDLLASLSIALDKPFKVGDLLFVGEEKGTVEHIGIKSTRLRSVTGEQIILSNSDLLKSRVRNFGGLFQRHVTFGVAVTRETPLKLIREIPGIIETVISAQPKIRFDRAHFTGTGEYSLNFEAGYTVLDPDGLLHLDAQQTIQLGLREEFERRRIRFAYPTARRLSESPAEATVAAD